MTPSYFRQQLKRRFVLFKRADTENDRAYWRGAGQELLYIMVTFGIITEKQWLILNNLFA